MPAVPDRYELLLMRFARSISDTRQAARTTTGGLDWQKAIADAVGKRTILRALLVHEHQRRHPGATPEASDWWARSRDDELTVKARWFDGPGIGWDTGLPTRTPMTSEPEEDQIRVAAALRWLAHLTVYVAAQEPVPPKAFDLDNLAVSLMAADLEVTDPQTAPLMRHVRARQEWDELLAEAEKEETP